MGGDGFGSPSALWGSWRGLAPLPAVFPLPLLVEAGNPQIAVDEVQHLLAPAVRVRLETLDGFFPQFGEKCDVLVRRDRHCFGSPLLACASAMIRLSRASASCRDRYGGTRVRAGMNCSPTKPPPIW